MNYWIYILLSITVIISGCSVLLFPINGKTLKLILAFSGGYLLSITVLHLIPEIYTSDHLGFKNLDGLGNGAVGMFILIGFLLQIFIEYFSEGIEHGHIHLHKHEPSFPISVMLALSIHSFIEGIPLAGNMDTSKQSLATGIILHNIPIAIALMSMLLQSGQSKQKAILWLIVFALMTPLGTFTGNLLEGNNGFISNYTNYLMAVVVGIFLHVSTTILFESSEHHRFHIIKLAVILAGMGLAMIAI